MRAFLIREDLQQLLDGGWETHKAFVPFVDHLKAPRKRSRKEEEEDERNKIDSSPLAYKQHKDNNEKLRLTLDKRREKMKRTEEFIQGRKNNKPDSYWTSLHKLNGSTLTNVYNFLHLPKQTFDDQLKKNRSVTAKEKRDGLEASRIGKDQFDDEITNNKNAIARIDEKLAGMSLGSKEFLLRTFLAADLEERCNKVTYSFPLHDLFGCQNDENVMDLEITVENVNEQIENLECEIEEDKKEINRRAALELTTTPSSSEDDNLITEEQDRQESEIPPENTREENEGNGETLFEDVCRRQAQIFVKKAHDQFMKHFPRWSNQLIFFGVASEKETANVVADYLLGNDLDYTKDKVYESTVHNRAIELGEFADYLDKTGQAESLEDVQKSSYFVTHRNGIKKLSEGEDLWNSGVKEVNELQTFVKQAVLPTPSNTQFVELFVKEAGHVSAKNRSESLRSIFAIIRACTNMEANRMAQKEARTRTLCANQYTKGGKIGERVMKFKTTEQDKESRIVIRGSHKAKHFINCAMKASEGLDDVDIDAMGAALLNRSTSFAVKKAAATMTKYRAGMNRKRRRQTKKTATRCKIHR